MTGSGVPEWSVVRWGFPLNLAWEFAQSPLYADWDREWTYLLWTRLHCTAGDVLILLGACWGTALVFRTRHWLGVRRLGPLVFIVLGLSYTVWSEWLNVSIRASWGYAPGMPALGGVGLSPLLQWVVVPALTLRLSRPRSAAQ